MKINTIIENKKLLFTQNVIVRWGDMDAFLHVNNAMYFRYLEEARIQWLADTGCFTEENQKEGPVLLQISNTFLVPVYYPAILIIRYYLKELGRTSITLIHQISKKEETEILCSEGESKIVWTNKETKKSIPFPDNVRKTCE